VILLEGGSVVTLKNHETSMKMKRNTLLAIGIFSIVIAKAQDADVTQQYIYPEGFCIEYGFGRYAVKDEYISGQKYSGNLPYFSLNWSRFKNGHGIALGIESRSSAEVYNYDVACNVTQTTLKQDFFYSVSRLKLFKKDIHSYFGPSVNILLYSLDYDFGTYNHVITESNGTIVSLGLNSQNIYCISRKLFAEGAVHLNLASICSKAFQSYRYDEAEFKFLIMPKAMNTNLYVGFRYYLFSSLSVKAAYKFQLYRIYEWDPMIAISNNLIFSVSYHFKKGGR
jgi:hypothetical protein